MSAELLIGAVHLVGLGLLIYGVYRCWCRRTPAAVQEEAASAAPTPEQLQPQKRRLNAYLLWLCCGWCGAHHFYLERVLHGLLCCWTLNFFYVGWLLDGILIPCYVCDFNRNRASPKAPWDRNLCRLCCRLLLVVVALVLLCALVVLQAPAALQWFGIVDLERLAAQTKQNPYVVLGIDRTASPQEAKSAYRKASLQWHPDKNPGCGKECDEQMAEITKAYEAVKRKSSLAAGDGTWQSWLRDLGTDWYHVFVAFTSDPDPAQGGGHGKKAGSTEL